MNEHEFGHDYEKDSVVLAVLNEELTKMNNVYRRQIVDLSDSLRDMMFAFNCLTQEGGWDTMDQKMKDHMLEYLDKATKVIKLD